MNNKFLVIGEGFEYILDKSLNLFLKANPKFQDCEFDVVFLSSYEEGEYHYLTDMEDEASKCSKITRVWPIRRDRKVLYHLRSIKQTYTNILMCYDGDKQFIILLLGWILRFISLFRSQYFSIELRSSKVKRISQKELYSIIFRRFVNKNFFNFLLTRFALFLKLTRGLGYPDSLAIEATNDCPLQCLACPTGIGNPKRVKGKLEMVHFKKLMDELGGYLRWLDISGFGEPFLHPKITDMVRYAKQKGVRFVQIDTNANVKLHKDKISDLIEAGADLLIISMDGINQVTYSKYRKNGKIDRVMEFTKQLVAEKKRRGSLLPKVVWQYIIMSHNQYEIDDFIKLASKLDVDHFRIKYLWCCESLDPATFKELMPEGKYSDYFVDEKGQIRIKPENRFEGCKNLWTMMFILWDGTAIPCCFDSNLRHKFGSVFNEGGIKKIWSGPKYRKFRETILKQKSTIRICDYCPGK